jgi:hypothetical protein
MKSSYLRAGFALLCAAILSACGGNNGSLTLSGAIQYIGPAKAGLVLINNSNGEKLTIDTGVTTIIFTKLLSTDEAFDVTILSEPTGAKCTIADNKGTANYYTVGRIVVTCTATPFTLGGNVKGLKGTGLVLANGADTVPVAPPATAGADVAFNFPAQVPNGALYGGTVLTQPTGQTCAFDPALNPGTMPNAEQKGLIVNCTNN